jgi:hypothetical protein
MTATQIVNKLALKCCGVFFAYSGQCVNSCVYLRKSKQTSQLQIIAKFASAHFQHEPKDHFLKEHINVSNLFEMNETQVLKGLYYSLPQ